MTKVKSKKEIVDEFLASTPKDLEYFVDHTMGIAYQVSNLLKSKNMTKDDLSKILGKDKSEISKWLSGNHNLTLKTISKLEAALGKQLIFTRDEEIS